jgi:crotonobetainyl-CoA:carnitine CoA-transferase CaiB-like acyl-CoA transferase
VGNDGQFRKLCEAAGCAELGGDERFATNKARVKNRLTLIPLLKQRTVLRPTAEWIALLETVGVPCGPINSLADVFADPQVIARGLKVEMPMALDTAESGAAAVGAPLVASPIRLSETPVTYRHAPPRLGQDTDAVLARLLGADESALARLRADGVI